VRNIEVKVDMPGTVIKLEKKPGNTVVAGEVLMLIESMKMEVDVASTATGILIAFAVSVGDHVNDGDSIATVQAA